MFLHEQMSHTPEACYAVVEDRLGMQYYSQCSGDIQSRTFSRSNHTVKDTAC